MNCPSFETLALFDRQQLTAVLKENVSTHLSQPCNRCRERLNWFQQTAMALRTPLERGPESLMDNARRLFQRSVYADYALPNILFARLAFDSSNLDRRVGARSVEFSANSSRHLLYHAEVPKNLYEKIIPANANTEQNSFDIDIAIKRVNDNNISLRGQILCAQEEQNFTERISIHLYKAGQRVQSANANRFGEFVFAEMVEGEYSIQIKTEHWTTIINLPTA